jgi:hypothetical protein
VLTRQLGRLGVVGERGTDAGHLVRRDLLTVARAADDDAEGAVVGDNAPSSFDAERRVVVLSVVDVRAHVDDVVAGTLEVLDEVVLQLVTGMVTSQIHAHAPKCAMDGAGRLEACSLRTASAYDSNGARTAWMPSPSTAQS